MRIFGWVSQYFILFSVLVVLWLVLSGHYSPLLLGLGLASVCLVTLILARMDTVDQEEQSFRLKPFGLLGYWTWLLWQIGKANWSVIRVILHPRLPIRPFVLREKMSQHSDLARVLYANSITLTPGTVAIDVDANEVLVHALHEDAASGVQEGHMNRRVREVEPASVPPPSHRHGRS